ncbi:MAG: PQQ-binding-like beta-propeller repeat protein, partial [Planctomycetes bacterium]|nr:PQQ-binding-like beta-propeller repeat protein [Planctomycetota bacterium]
SNGNAIVRWSRTVPGATFAANSPVIAGHRVYVASAAAGGTLYCYRLNDGQLLWSRGSSGGAYQNSPTCYGGYLFAVTEAGTVEAFGDPTSSGWRRAAVGLQPAPRTEPAMAFELGRVPRVALMFGGVTITSGIHQYHRDTWQWDGANWTQLASVGPTARAGHAMVHDYTSQPPVTVMFGGHSTDASGSAMQFHSGTWGWGGTMWTQLAAAGPSLRTGHAMAFDSLNQGILLFGGASATSRYGDTWWWNGTGWAPRSQNPAPSRRRDHAMVYDSHNASVVMFGGVDGSSYHGDTWTYDGSSWAQRSTTGPSARAGHAMAYDDNLGIVLMYGGHDDAAQFGDTWEWDTAGVAWTRTEVLGPGARSGHAMAHDRYRVKAVLFGGERQGAMDGETWEHGQDRYLLFGQGCTGTAGTPFLSAAPGVVPRLGQVFTVAVEAMPAGTFVFGAFGFSRRHHGPYPLPLDLTPFGAPGCEVYTGPVGTVLVLAPAGTASWSLQLPYSPGLVGMAFYQQAFVYDPAANVLGLVTSNAGRGIMSL